MWTVSGAGPGARIALAGGLGTERGEGGTWRTWAAAGRGEGASRPSRVPGAFVPRWRKCRGRGWPQALGISAPWLGGGDRPGLLSPGWHHRAVTVLCFVFLRGEHPPSPCVGAHRGRGHSRARARPRPILYWNYDVGAEREGRTDAPTETPPRVRAGNGRDLSAGTGAALGRGVRLVCPGPPPEARPCNPGRACPRNSLGFDSHGPRSHLKAAATLSSDPSPQIESPGVGHLRAESFKEGMEGVDVLTQRILMGWEERSRMWVPATTETWACGRCCPAGLCWWEGGSHPDLEPGSCLLSQGLDAVTTAGTWAQPPLSSRGSADFGPSVLPFTVFLGTVLGSTCPRGCSSPTLVSDQPQK